MDNITRAGSNAWHGRMPTSEAMLTLRDCLYAGADGGHVAYMARLDHAITEQIGTPDSARYARIWQAVKTWTYGDASPSDDVDYLMDESNPQAIDTGVQRRKMYTSLLERSMLYPSCGMFAAWLKHEAQRLARHKTGKDTSLALIYAQLRIDVVDYLATLFDDAIPGTSREIVGIATYAANLIAQDKETRRVKREAWARMYRSNINYQSSRKRRTR